MTNVTLVVRRVLWKSNDANVRARKNVRSFANRVKYDESYALKRAIEIGMQTFESVGWLKAAAVSKKITEVSD